MIKKVTIGLVILLLLTGLWAGLSYMGIVPGFSDGKGSGGWSWEKQNDKLILTAYHGHESNPVIPAELDGTPVDGLGEGVFASNTRIESVTIPETITFLGNRIFENCTGLKQVFLPDTLETIPSKTFSGCSSLRSIRLPESLTSIGSGAFNGCTGLTELTIPDNVTSISAEAFQNCSALSAIHMSKNLKSVGTHAFLGTEWLSRQSDEFVLIGNQILIKYNGISEHVTVPAGVTQVTDAFEDNLFPLEIELPESLTSIGGRAFSGCRSLETINIPKSVRSIGSSAFRGCSHLALIQLPETMRTIGSSAFQSCSALTRLRIPEGVSSLPSLAFANCENLRILEIPKSVKEIADDIISYSGISELRVYKGSQGEEFAIKKGIPYSYMQQTSEDFIFQQTENGIQVILYNGELFDVTIPETIEGEPVTSLSDILFQHNDTVRSVSLPDSITRINDFSFAHMAELRSVRLPENLESIGTSAFEDDPMLGSIYIPPSVTEIAEDAFLDCPSLVIQAEEGSYAYEWAASNGIKIEDDLTETESDYTFINPFGQILLSEYKGDETDLILPAADGNGREVSGISEYAFYRKDLTSVQIPEGYETIGEFAFAESLPALDVTIPRSVQSIGERSFEDTEVTIHGYNGSYAENYARKHKIKFLVIFEWELEK